ncbi:MAG: universal stress protein [Rhodospirillales bacterium]|jgi:nucleotide-binding universal stress UspA family protein|nr:universal stress protein [Rhodospirillales bacterium]MDP6883559.1 universal stress protein [Rhodospirillales bacterium]
MAEDTNQPTGGVQASQRTFLCVVDETEELSQALRFACRRAVRTGGRVALLYVIQPAEFQHWTSVGDLMREERRAEAEEMLQVLSSVVQKRTKTMPALYIREGKIREELIKLIDEETDISVLVLGAATGEGPGPIVSYLVGKMAGRLRIPITIVPGALSDEQIDAIT